MVTEGDGEVGGMERGSPPPRWAVQANRSAPWLLIMLGVWMIATNLLSAGSRFEPSAIIPFLLSAGLYAASAFVLRRHRGEPPG